MPADAAEYLGALARIPESAKHVIELRPARGTDSWDSAVTIVVARQHLDKGPHESEGGLALGIAEGLRGRAHEELMHALEIPPVAGRREIAGNHQGVEAGSVDVNEAGKRFQNVGIVAELKTEAGEATEEILPGNAGGVREGCQMKVGGV